MGKLAEMLEHPHEILPMAKMYFQTQKALRLPNDPKLAFCYQILTSVSRSFAVVIQQLPVSLRDAVCVFYLVLRALDTVEDDMAIPLDEKVPLLRSFHEMIYDRGLSLDYGEKHYKKLLNQFGTVVDVFLGLEDGLKVRKGFACELEFAVVWYGIWSWAVFLRLFVFCGFWFGISLGRWQSTVLW